MTSYGLPVDMADTVNYNNSCYSIGGHMSRKPATTREDMIEGAFQLIRKEGMTALTARRLAEELNCSTQPIMYQFPNLNDLRELVYEKADRFHTEYILKDEDFLEIGLRYIRFASEEGNLFRFLFQSGRFDGFNISQLTREGADDGVIAAAARDLEMPQKDALDFFEILFPMVHGYGSLVANNALEYDEEALRRNLTAAAEGLVSSYTRTEHE